MEKSRNFEFRLDGRGEGGGCGDGGKHYFFSENQHKFSIFSSKNRQKQMALMSKAEEIKNNKFGPRNSHSSVGVKKPFFLSESAPTFRLLRIFSRFFLICTSEFGAPERKQSGN